MNCYEHMKKGQGVIDCTGSLVVELGRGKIGKCIARKVLQLHGWGGEYEQRNV